MSIDLSQFLGVFFEESFEGLAVMESGLLELPEGMAERQVVDSIFRAAHSIKGGAGTFGLNGVTEFTHRLETLLDEIREGRRAVTAASRDALLRATDVLANMLRTLQQGGQVDQTSADAMARELDAILGASPVPAGPLVRAATNPARDAGEWNLHFRPHVHFFRTGNEPLRLLRELGELGDARVRTDLASVPPLSELDPEDCHLDFHVQVTGDVTEADLRSVFDWVDGDCDLEMSRAGAAGAAAPAVALVADAALVPTAAAQERSAVSGGPAAATSPAPESRPAAARPADHQAQSIRVGIDKIDAVINLVGELVITQSMLSRFGEQFDADMLEALRDGLAQLERNTRELQETVLKIRMLPISVCFSRFPRLVHDLSARLGKQVELKLSGEQTELDKTVLENIGDPLVHLVRNCLDHGIEAPAKRVAAGKPATGTLSLQARHEGGSIIIQVSDDGGGLDRERILARAIERGLVPAGEAMSDQAIDDIIFLPGFSTAEVLSDVSGRGVGMDVVRRNILALGGHIEVVSRPGEGTLFSIRLPLTLAILDGQLIEVGGQVFVVPLISIVESLQMDQRQLRTVAGRGEVYRLREEYIPTLRMRQAFDLQAPMSPLQRSLLVVVEAEGTRVGLVVDDLLAQQQVVIKSLESNYRQIEGVSGATILGDGSVALILDINTLVRDGAGQRLIHAA